MDKGNTDIGVEGNVVAVPVLFVAVCCTTYSTVLVLHLPLFSRSDIDQTTGRPELK